MMPEYQIDSRPEQTWKEPELWAMKKDRKLERPMDDSCRACNVHWLHGKPKRWLTASYSFPMPGNARLELCWQTVPGLSYTT